MVSALMFGLILLVFYVIYESLYQEIKEEKANKIKKRDEA